MTALARLILGRANRVRVSNFNDGFSAAFQLFPAETNYRAMISTKSDELDDHLKGILDDQTRLRGDFCTALGHLVER